MPYDSRAQCEVVEASQAPSQFHAVVFDMDGVIFDTESLYFEAEVEMLERRGQTFRTELAQRIMGLPGITAMELLRAAHGLADAPEALFAECQALFRSRVATRLTLMPGFERLMDRLEQRGLAKAVATSTRRQLTTEMLGAYDLEPRFRCVLTADDVTHGKPHPEIYQLACRRLGTEPPNTLVIEDSLNGTKSAAAAGCFCVAAPHALSRSLDFSHANLVVDHLLDERLLELL
jgi:HAD superfamily hydrolase (TIGR01509 family)